MKIMIFIEGTIFRTRPPLFLFTKYGYTPIGRAAEKINRWYDAGNEIYLCSYVRRPRIGFIRSVMDFYGIKYTGIFCRAKGERYREIVERLKPDILIEDDCRSIGGQKNCCITEVENEIKKNIRSILVPEFGGIDHVEITV